MQSDLNESKASEERTTTSLQKTIAKLHAELESTKESSRLGEVVEKDKEMSELQSRLNDLSSLQQSQATELQSLLEQLGQKQATIEALEDQLSEYQSKLVEYEKDNAQTIQEERASALELRASVLDLQSKLESTTLSECSLRERLSVLESEYEV